MIKASAAETSEMTLETFQAYRVRCIRSPLFSSSDEIQQSRFPKRLTTYKTHRRRQPARIHYKEKIESEVNFENQVLIEDITWKRGYCLQEKRVYYSSEKFVYFFAATFFLGAAVFFVALAAAALTTTHMRLVIIHLRN